MTTPLRPRITGCEHKFDYVVQCPTCGVPNTMVQWRLEAEAAPDLRAALERLVRLTDGWDDMIRGSEWLEAIEQARTALAAPAADGLDVERLRKAASRALPFLVCDVDDKAPTHICLERAIHDELAAALHEPSREPGEEDV